MHIALGQPEPQSLTVQEGRPVAVPGSSDIAPTTAHSFRFSRDVRTKSKCFLFGTVLTLIIHRCQQNSPSIFYINAWTRMKLQFRSTMQRSALLEDVFRPEAPEVTMSSLVREEVGNGPGKQRYDILNQRNVVKCFWGLCQVMFWDTAGAAAAAASWWVYIVRDFEGRILQHI